MSDLELGLPTREPPLDSVLDGYYSGHQYTDKAKLSAIKNVMKSAISITKSKTGNCAYIPCDKFQCALTENEIITCHLTQ